MGKFSKVLFAADFDRTLTDYQSQIPQANLNAIREFQAQGGAFTVATGRSVPMFMKDQGKIPVNAPLILYNGAATYDSASGKLDDVVAIDHGRELMADLYARFPHLWMEVQGIRYHELLGENETRLGYYRYAQAPCRPTTLQTFPLPLIKAAVYGRFRDHTVGQFFSGSPEEIAELDEVERYVTRVYAQVATAERAAPRIVDIGARGVSKGRAARALAEKLHRPVLVCAGDALNDVSMLRQADYAFVPADCEQAVAAMGFRQTVPCAQGAVASAIRQLEALL